MRETILLVSIFAAGYVVRWAMDYQMVWQYKAAKRRRAEVSVDTARMLNGITDKVPAVTISPLIRQYLTERKMIREQLLAWIMRYKPYVPRHSASGLSTSELIAIQVPTAVQPAVSDGP